VEVYGTVFEPGFSRSDRDLSVIVSSPDDSASGICSRPVALW